MLVLTPEAEADIDEACRWYGQRGSCLGDAFLQSARAALSSVEQFPEGYPQVYRSTRRALLRRFPYGLLYSRSDDTYYVLGCFHTSQDPSALERRLDL
ncbi:MAG: type II toxin-antitoxin system RelE/ParE family toxin [Actinomycetes bacterium]